MNQSAIMRYISLTLHTCVSFYSKNLTPLSSYSARQDFSSHTVQPECLVRNFFKTGIESVSLPFIFSVNNTYIYSVIPFHDEYIVIGPNVFSDNVYLKHKIPNFKYGKHLPKSIVPCSFHQYINLLLLFYSLEKESPVMEIDLINENCFEQAWEEEAQKTFSSITFDAYENGKLHNPYDQEIREQTSIENGDIENLKESIREDYAGALGILAKDKIRHHKNLAIVLIVLSCRSAIEGGLSSELAFSLSDSYIRQVEECHDTVSPMQLARSVEFHYASMVHELKEQKKGASSEKPNPHITQCKNYIYSHLHQKLTVREIADDLNINADYLSSLFKQHEGIPLSQYIMNEKINRAKNMVTYSGYTFLEIAMYLGFTSQSHLGSHFKKITGYTLKQYQDKYGQAVW